MHVQYFIYIIHICIYKAYLLNNTWRKTLCKMHLGTINHYINTTFMMSVGMSFKITTTWMTGCMVVLHFCFQTPASVPPGDSKWQLRFSGPPPTLTTTLRFRLQDRALGGSWGSELEDTLDLGSCTSRNKKTNIKRK